MQSYLSGKYWWLGVAVIVVLTLVFFHGLVGKPPAPQPAKQIVSKPVAKPVSKPSIPTHPVLELFNPSTENITRDQAISRIRSELEQLLVINLLLHECAILSDEDSQAITRAGTIYANRTKLFGNADALMQELGAQAQETYKLVYAQTSCDEQSLQSLKEQTLSWLAQFNAIP